MKSEQALERVRTRPDLVILDIRLPDIPGYEICRRIKQDPFTGDIPVIQVSAYIGEQGKQAARQSGADALLVHPIDRAVLRDLVHSFFSAASPMDLASAKRPASG